MNPADGGKIPVELTVSEDDVDVVSDWLWSNGASAVVEVGKGDGVTALIGDLPSSVAELAESAVGTEPLIDELSGVVGWPVVSGRIRELVIGSPEDDRELAGSWKHSLEPTRCGRFLIVPEWQRFTYSGRLRGHQSGPVDDGVDHLVPLFMDPGDAFGAGTHVTTRLCLEAVGNVVRGGENVLDFGCGTGVLGVGAVLVGAEKVVAIDIDPEAIRVTNEVARLNDVPDLITASADPLEAVPGRYGLILANTLIGVIEEFGPQLVDKLDSGGTIVISGIIAEQRDRAVRALEPLIVTDQAERDGWLRIQLARDHLAS